MCGNPLNAAAVNWRSLQPNAGVIVIDGQFRPVGNFVMVDPGTVDLEMNNLLPGGMYRFAVNGDSTTAALTLPLNAYYEGGGTINLTFTGEQWYWFDFTFDGAVILISQKGGTGTPGGPFAQLNAPNVFNQVPISGFTGLVQTGNGPSFAFANSDTGKIYRLVHGSPMNAQFPKTAPVGWMVTCIQSGAGQVTFVPESGATLQNRSGHSKTAGLYAVVSMVCQANGDGNSAEVVLSGDTTI
jgi:hypothetical protein